MGAKGFAALGAFILGLVSIGIGRAQESRAAWIEREIAFGRGLAADFGFLELAEEALSRLAGAEGLDADSQERIGLVRCDLSLLEVREQSEIQGKWALLDETLGRIGQSVARLQGKQRGVEARELYLRGALDFAEILEFMLEDEARAAVRAGRLEKAEEVLKAAIVSAHEIRVFYKPRLEFDCDARDVFFWTWMTQGELAKDWAFLAPVGDRTARLQQAKQTITELIFWISEETIVGTRGLILLAQCYEFEDKAVEAQATYSDVIDNIWRENLKNTDKEIPASQIPLLTRLMEEAYVSLIRLHNRLGRTNEAVAAGAEMIARIREIAATCKDVQYSMPQGLRALVEYADALRKAGEAEKALRVAADVSARARNAVVGFRARRLIGRILDDPGARLDPWLALKASTGWLEWREGTVREARGLDRLAPALEQTLPGLLGRVDTEERRCSLEWYRVVCHYAYVAYRAGRGESGRLEEAARLLGAARGGAGFAGVKQARPVREASESLDRLDPAERKLKEGELEQEREELFQFFLYLSDRLEQRSPRGG